MLRFGGRGNDSPELNAARMEHVPSGTERGEGIHCGEAFINASVWMMRQR